MAEDLDTDQAQEEVTEETQTDTVEAGQDESAGENPFGLTEAQLDALDQRNASHFGRIVANQIEEKVMPALNQMQQPAAAPESGPVGDEFDQALQDKFYSGDVGGAIDMYLQRKNTTAQNQQQQADAATKQAITSLSDEPLYKELYDDINTLTAEYRKQGYPPPAAASTAYQTAKARYLEKQMSNGSEAPLGMAGGGKRPQSRPGRVKLAPQFRAAADRDIAKGIFKDDQDYINNLDPAIREQYGMV